MSQLQAARRDDCEHLEEHAGVEMPGVRKPLVRRFAGSPEAVVHVDRHCSALRRSSRLQEKAARVFARNRNSYRAALRCGNALGIVPAGSAGWVFPVDRCCSLDSITKHGARRSRCCATGQSDSSEQEDSEEALMARGGCIIQRIASA